MLHNVSIMNAAHQIASEGVIHLYRGVLPPLCQKSISVSLMFGIYDKAKQPLLRADFNPYLATVVAAITAGSIECILLPFERLQTLLQHERYHKDLHNMKHAVSILWRQHGVSEFYRGLTPVLVRNGPSNAMFFLLREEASETIPQASTTAGMILRQFSIGALIGAMCSTVFYPCNVLKVHMQSRIGGPFQSVPTAIGEIFRERGSVRAFFRGVHLNYTRSCISWGVINTAYEGLKRVL